VRTLKWGEHVSTTSPIEEDYDGVESIVTRYYTDKW